MQQRTIVVQSAFIANVPDIFLAILFDSMVSKLDFVIMSVLIIFTITISYSILIQHMHVLMHTSLQYLIFNIQIMNSFVVLKISKHCNKLRSRISFLCHQL